MLFKECKCRKPVFLTMNSHGHFVIFDINDFEIPKDKPKQQCRKNNFDNKYGTCYTAKWHVPCLIGGSN